MRPTRRRTLVTIPFLAFALWASVAHAGPCDNPSTAPANGQCLEFFRRLDGRVETYFGAGSALLTGAFDLLAAFWNDPIKWQTRMAGDLDRPIPIELMKAGHNGAIAMQGRLGILLRQNMVQGLLAAPGRTYQSINMPMRLGMVARSLPNDTRFIIAAMRHVTATQRAFGTGHPGVFPYVDVNTKQPTVAVAASDVCHKYPPGGGHGFYRVDLATIGHGMRGMIEIMAAAGDSAPAQWILDKLTFLEQLIPAGSQLMSDKYTEDADCNDEAPTTDNLYLAREMFESVRAIDEVALQAFAPLRARLLQRGKLLADAWIQHGWFSTGAHYLTRRNFDYSLVQTGGGPLVDLLGDSKWNYLYALVDAVEFTPSNSEAYLTKAIEHYRVMTSQAHSPLIDCNYYTGGQSGGDGEIDGDGILVADAMTQLYKVAQRPGVTLPHGVLPEDFRQAAVTLGTQLLARRGQDGCTGPYGVRYKILSPGDREGWATTRVALGTQTVRRLEISLPSAGSFTVRRCALLGCTETALAATLPSFSDVAVVFLPQGLYSVTYNNISKPVMLTSNQLLSF